MRYELTMGPPSYREPVGKTCAVIEVTIQEPAEPGDQWVDPRGHVWTVDYAEEGTLPGHTSLTMFCPTTTATLKQNEEIHRHERPVHDLQRSTSQLRRRQ